MKRHIANLLSLFLVLLISACGDGTTADQHIQKAQTLIQQNQVQAALIELKNALQKEPDNAAARLTLGRIYLRRGDYLSAEKELQNALKYGAQATDVVPDLAQALVKIGKSEDVLALRVDTLSPPADANLLATQAIAQLALKRNEEAERLLSKAEAMQPQSATVQIARASLLFFSEPDFKKARRQLNRLLDAHPGYIPALAMLGDIEAQEGKYEAAVENYTEVLKTETDNYEALNKRALAHIYAKQLDLAQADIDALKKRYPKSPALHYSQGLVYMGKERFADAKASFEGVLVAVERYPMALMHLAMVANQLGDSAQAETYAEQFLSAQPDHRFARLLLAGLKYKKGQDDEVEALLEPLLEKHPDDSGALNILARVRLRQGDSNQAIEMLRRVAQLQPQSAKAQVTLGAALLQIGSSAEGFEILKQSIQLDENSDLADTALIVGYLGARQFDNALAAASDFERRKPDSDVPHVLIGDIHAALGKTAEARSAYARAAKINPQNIGVLIKLSNFAHADKDYKKARSLLEQVLEINAGHLQALIKLVEIDRAENNEEQMVRHLEQAIQAHPGSFYPRYQLARHYLGKGESEQVSGLLETLDTQDKKRPEIIELLLHQQLMSQNYTEAEKLAKRLVGLRPSAAAYLLLAQAYSGVGDDDSSEAALFKSLELDSDYLPARVVLARRFLAQGNDEELNAALNRLRELAPGNQDVLQLELSAATRRGDKATAEALAEKIYTKFATFNNMVVLARLKNANGDTQAFIDLHNHWLESHPDSLPAELSLADYYRVRGNKSDAVSAYQRLLSKHPDNLVVLNNLSGLLLDSDPAKGLVYAKKAAEIASESPSVMDTLAMAHLANGEHVIAERIIQKARDAAPNDLTLQYHQAKIYLEVGKRQQAYDNLQVIKRSTKDFPERAEAEELLESM